MASIIKVEHLSYVYNPGMPNAVTALDDVSFEVEEGDFVGIIGATGSGKSTLITHMNGLNKDLGITVVAITHYMEEAAQADRVLVMSQGHVVMEGTPKEVFSQTEKVRALRLDVPQAAELRDELVKAGIPMPEGIIDTGECAQALYELLQ